MKILIIDDEELARARLKEILAGIENIEISGEAANGLEALEKITATKPDAIFLDVEMPGLNGFEVIENLIEPPLVVFATAYDEYAVKAFETNAIDYILKPFQAERIRHTVEKIIIRNVEQKSVREIKTLAEKLSKMQNSHQLDKVVVRRANRFFLISLAKIIFFRIENTILFVHTADERFRCDKSIGEIEERLTNTRFFRINRSEIINLECVTEIIPWFSGTIKLKLSDNQEFQVSRERSKGLREILL